jgi:hypothetical protein
MNYSMTVKQVSLLCNELTFQIVSRTPENGESHPLKIGRRRTPENWKYTDDLFYSIIILDSLWERLSKEVLCIEAVTQTGKVWLVGTPLKATQLGNVILIIFFSRQPGKVKKYMEARVENL